ncbi:MAG: single-stranded DNA-binding protein [Chloroflexota bacterium]
MSTKSLNRAQLIGNLGRDPELRSTPNGVPVCTISVATTDSYKDKSGAWQESTDWHTVVLWEKLAEIANQYLKKGSKVFIEGKIKTRSYEKDGVTRYVTEIRATNMLLLGGRDTAHAGDSPQVSDGFGSMASGDDFLDQDDEVPF